MINWVGENAAAIQALTSAVALIITAVLAVLTHQYVKLTREVSRASADQVALMRDQFAIARRQQALALVALCQRIRIPLDALDPRGAGFKQLKNLSQLGASDIQDLSSFARGIDEEAVMLAGKAASALRVLLKLHERVKLIPDQVAWIADQAETAEYLEARDAAPRRLAELEAVARRAVA